MQLKKKIKISNIIFNKYILQKFDMNHKCIEIEKIAF